MPNLQQREPFQTVSSVTKPNIIKDSGLSSNSQILSSKKLSCNSDLVHPGVKEKPIAVIEYKQNSSEKQTAESQLTAGCNRFQNNELRSITKDIDVSNALVKDTDDISKILDEIKVNMNRNQLRCLVSCASCCIDFTRQSYFETHIKQFANKSDCCCPLCGKKSTLQLDFLTHMKLHFDTNLIIAHCKVCNAVFYNTHNKLIHERLKHPNCNDPNLNSEIKLKTPKFGSNGESAAKIPNCPSVTGTTTSVKGPGNEECAKIVRDIIQYFDHYKLVVGAMENKALKFVVHCVVCSKDVAAETYMQQQHQRNCVTEKVFNCSLCALQMGIPASPLENHSALSHIRKHLIAPTKLIECEFCCNVFFNSNNYKAHVKCHPLYNASLHISKIDSDKFTLTPSGIKWLKDVEMLFSRTIDSQHQVGKKYMIHCLTCFVDIPYDVYLKFHFKMCLQNQCFICGIPTPNLQLNISNHLTHIKSHFSKQMHARKCSKCKTEFINYYNYLQHFSRHHHVKRQTKCVQSLEQQVPPVPVQTGAVEEVSQADGSEILLQQNESQTQNSLCFIPVEAKIEIIETSAEELPETDAPKTWTWTDEYQNLFSFFPMEDKIEIVESHTEEVLEMEQTESNCSGNEDSAVVNNANSQYCSQVLHHPETIASSSTTNISKQRKIPVDAEVQSVEPRENSYLSYSIKLEGTPETSDCEFAAVEPDLENVKYEAHFSQDSSQDLEMDSHLGSYCLVTADEQVISDPLAVTQYHISDNASNSNSMDSNLTEEQIIFLNDIPLRCKQAIKYIKSVSKAIYLSVTEAILKLHNYDFQYMVHCVSCLKDFPYIEFFEFHFEQCLTQSTTNYQCTFCGMNITPLNSIKKQQPYIHLNTYLIHIQKHLDSDQFLHGKHECLKCCYKFPVMLNTLFHLASIHPPDKPPASQKSRRTTVPCKKPRIHTPKSPTLSATASQKSRRTTVSCKKPRKKAP